MPPLGGLFLLWFPATTLSMMRRRKERTRKHESGQRCGGGRRIQTWTNTGENQFFNRRASISLSPLLPVKKKKKKKQVRRINAPCRRTERQTAEVKADVRFLSKRCSK